MSAAPTPAAIRTRVEDLARERGETLQALSKYIGRNPAYLQQFVRRGTPVRLPEEERRLLAIALNVDERHLGARDPWAPGMRCR